MSGTEIENLQTKKSTTMIPSIRIEESDEYKQIDSQIQRNIAKLRGSESVKKESDGETKLTQIGELTTPRTETEELLNQEPVRSVETQLMDSPQHSRNLRKDAEAGIALIDSTANDLHSYMKGLFANKTEPEIQAYQVDKVQAACLAGRTINELMKTKIEMLNAANELPGEITVPNKE